MDNKENKVNIILPQFNYFSGTRSHDNKTILIAQQPSIDLIQNIVKILTSTKGFGVFLGKNDIKLLINLIYICTFEEIYDNKVNSLQIILIYLEIDAQMVNRNAIIYNTYNG